MIFSFFVELGVVVRRHMCVQRSPFNGHGGRVLRLRDGSEHAHRVLRVEFSVWFLFRRIPSLSSWMMNAHFIG